MHNISIVGFKQVRILNSLRRSVEKRFCYKKRCVHGFFVVLGWMEKTQS